MKSMGHIVAIVAWLTLVGGVVPCPLMLANPMPGAHDCCDHPDQHSDNNPTGCEVQCAQAAERVALQHELRNPDEKPFESGPSTADSSSLIRGYSARTLIRLALVCPHPPHYILNASFLV